MAGSQALVSSLHRNHNQTQNRMENHPHPPGMQPSACAQAPADLALLARPRYHVAGGQGVFYQRAPYTNPDLGAGPRATRFIGVVSPCHRSAGV
jgi:hypothetical protein